MSLTIKHKSGKRMGLTDSEQEYVMIENKKVPLADVYENDELRKKFNDSLAEEKTNVDE